MFESIWGDIKNNFRSGNMLTRIIMLNVTVFLIVLLANIFVKGFAGPEGYNTFLQFFMMSDDWWHNLTHPWVFFSYMFLHEGFWHLFWNMVVLYWFGNIVGDFLGDRVVLPTYLLSGLAGAAIYFFIANMPIPWMIGGYMLGASAAVNGFMMLAASKFPDYQVRLILIGPVRIKYVVAVFLIIDLVAISNNSNTGGHLAHIGGAAMGWFIVYLWNHQNIDLIGWTNGILDSIANFFKSLMGGKSTQGPTVRVDYQQPKAKKQPRKSQQSTPPPTASGQSHQEKLDTILDKIKMSGYDNLTAEEKDFLYHASKK